MLDPLRSALLAAVLVLGAARPARAETPPTDPKRVSSSPSGTVSATPEYRWLFGIPILGGEVSGAFGIGDTVDKPFQAEAALNAYFGRTPAGLPVVRGSVGALLDGRFGGFHAGALLGVGVVGLQRARGGWMTDLAYTTNVFVGPELVVSPGLVLSVDATLAADWITSGDATAIWGPGIGLRARVF